MDMQSPNVEELVALALGDLAPSQAAALEARVSRAPEARRLLTQIRSLVQTLESDDGVTPPAGLVQRVKELVGSAPEPTAGWGLREVVAALIFDSFGKVAVAGFRGSLAARQLAYSSEAAEVDVQVNSDGARRDIRGQVTPSSEARAADVSISKPGDDSVLARADVNERGEFCLESAPGTFDLRIRIGNTVVLLPSLNVM